MIVPSLANKEFLLKVPKIIVSGDGKYLGTTNTVIIPPFEYWIDGDSQLRNEPWVHYGLSHYNIDNAFLAPIPIGFAWYDTFKNIFKEDK